LGVACSIESDLTETDMVTAYRTAEVVVCPSTFEGFGLTPMEAIATATPVVASDIPPHREFLGASPHFFTLDDDDCLVAALGAAPAPDTRRSRCSARAARAPTRGGAGGRLTRPAPAILPAGRARRRSPDNLPRPLRAGDRSRRPRCARRADGYSRSAAWSTRAVAARGWSASRSPPPARTPTRSLRPACPRAGRSTRTRPRRRSHPSRGCAPCPPA